MTYVVRILGRAQADVDHIYLWLKRRSPTGAIAWYTAFLDKFSGLGESATACAQAPETARLGIELRQAFFKTRRGRSYRLLFVITGGEVRILRVRGPGQRPVSRRDLPSDQE